MAKHKNPNSFEEQDTLQVTGELTPKGLEFLVQVWIYRYTGTPCHVIS